MAINKIVIMGMLGAGVALAATVPSLDLPKDFDGPAAMDAMKGKILAQGEELGLFTQNPAKGAKVSP